jgi:hypothetical protein
MLRVALGRTDVSEELTKAIRRNVPEDDFLQFLFSSMEIILRHLEFFIVGAPSLTRGWVCNLELH